MELSLLLHWCRLLTPAGVTSTQSSRIRFLILFCTQRWVPTLTEFYQWRFSVGSGHWTWDIKMPIPQPHTRPIETESLRVGPRYLNFGKGKQNQNLPWVRYPSHHCYQRSWLPMDRDGDAHPHISSFWSCLQEPETAAGPLITQY